jgi:RNA polymerase sigma factor (sigma-70 family)
MSLDPQKMLQDIAAYRLGADDAADRLFGKLRPVVQREAARMLGSADLEVEDVTQECLAATLGYLRRDEQFAGDVVRLAATIARNRCRDILRNRRRRPHVPIDPLESWLATPDRSVLDELAETSLWALLQRVLDELGDACRQLLHDLYQRGLSTEEVRRRLGLQTLQGVYLRRDACLARANLFLQRALHGRSWTGSREKRCRDDRTRGESE